MVNRNTLTGPVFGLRREIDRLFEDTFGRDGRSAWVPPVDVREDRNEIVLEVELPGVKPDDVDVTAQNGVLTIHGEKRTSTDGGDGRYHVIERSYGSFTRSFHLPPGVDERRIEAEFADGVLTVNVPKAAIAEPRRIEIRNSGSQRTVRGPDASRGAGESASTAREPNPTPEG